MKKINFSIIILALSTILIEIIRGDQPWQIQDQSKLKNIFEKDSLVNSTIISNTETKKEKIFRKNNRSKINTFK